MSDFPAMDYERGDKFNRQVFETFGDVEAHVAELDSWCALPVRLSHDQAGGWQVELGPYTLNHADLLVLAAALRGWQDATGVVLT
jgi:hypothetical protein